MAGKRVKPTKRGRVIVRRTQFVDTGLFERSQGSVRGRTVFARLSEQEQREIVRRLRMGDLGREEEERLFALGGFERILKGLLTTSQWLDRYERRAREVLEKEGHRVPKRQAEAALLRLVTGAEKKRVREAARVALDVTVARRYLHAGNTEGLGQVCFRIAWVSMVTALTPAEPLVKRGRKSLENARAWSKGRRTPADLPKRYQEKAKAIWAKRPKLSARAVARKITDADRSPETIRRYIADLKPPE